MDYSESKLKHHCLSNIDDDDGDGVDVDGDWHRQTPYKCCL